MQMKKSSEEEQERDRETATEFERERKIQAFDQIVSSYKFSTKKKYSWT